MTQEETQVIKELLLKDLCARLPYKVKGVYARTDIKNLSICEITTHLYGEMEESYNGKEKYEFIPYLRPMSSMTDEEQRTLDSICNGVEMVSRLSGLKMFDKAFDWLNKNHFDYRGLIEKGLAIDATGLNIY